LKVIFTSEDLVLERSKFGFAADVVDLVDNSLDVLVLVDEYFGYQFLVVEVFVSEVQVCYVAGSVEACGDLIVEFFWENGLEDVAYVCVRTMCTWY